MADTKKSPLARHMVGATQDYKRLLRKSLDTKTYEATSAHAVQILKSLPADVPLGTMTAALMLAATAFAEGASHAVRLIDDKAAQ